MFIQWKGKSELHLLCRSAVSSTVVYPFECKPQRYSWYAPSCPGYVGSQSPRPLFFLNSSIWCPGFRTWAGTAWFDTIAVILTGIIRLIRPAVKTLHRAIGVVGNIIDTKTWFDSKRKRYVIGMWMNVPRQQNWEWSSLLPNERTRMG